MNKKANRSREERGGIKRGLEKKGVLQKGGGKDWRKTRKTPLQQKTDIG